MRQRSIFQWLLPIAACWFLTGACGLADESMKQAQQEGKTKLKQEWKLQTEKYIQVARDEKYPRKGGFYPDEVRILQSLLNEAPTNEVDVEFQRICAAAAVPMFSGDDRDLDGNYDHVLLQSFVWRSVDRRDAQQLIALLSHHCPRYIVYEPLEFYLAAQWPKSIEPLFACYAATKAPAVKQDIVFCLRRAFPSLRDRFPADDVFIKRAQSWYMGNRSKLAVNTKYQYLVSQPLQMPGVDTTNLFVYQSQ